MDGLPGLVGAARAGDAHAFGQLVVRFQHMAFASCLARIGDVQLAQDAAQEAFFDAWLNLRQLQEPVAFPSWFRRILIKHADRQTRTRTPRSVSPDQIDALADEHQDTAAVVATDERIRVVRQAVAALPESLRDPTILFYFEGYAQKEIAASLDISAAAVKKRLFLARKRLAQKGLAMVKNMSNAGKPSVSDDFATHIRLFVAMRAGDLSEIKALVLQYPELVSVRTVWGVGSDGHYWPLDATPLFWAVATDDEPLFSFLISQGAEVDVSDRHGFTPLHTAVQLRRPKLARLLLERGAPVDSESQQRQTPLMMAVLRGSRDMAQLLIDAGADLARTDADGRTATDWARLKRQPDILALLQDHGAPSSTTPEADPALPVPTDTTWLESGIKIVDAVAPITRGGHVGLFSPLAGVGIAVLIGQLAQNFVDRYDGHVIFTDIAAGAMTQASMDLLWRSELGLHEDLLESHLTSFFAAEGADDRSRLQTVQDALARVAELQAAGHEVLHFIDAELAGVEGAIAAVRDQPARAPAACATTIWHGDFTAGLEPPCFDFVDGVITFSRARARQRLFPAVDPLRSWSRPLRDADAGDAHGALVRDLQRTLLRYDDLHEQYEYKGFDALFYLDDLESDRSIVTRARRLTRFLTQPFVGVEPYTGRPGVRCSMEQALTGCRRILQGEADDLPEEAFEYAASYETVS